MLKDRVPHAYLGSGKAASGVPHRWLRRGLRRANPISKQSYSSWFYWMCSPSVDVLANNVKNVTKLHWRDGVEQLLHEKTSSISTTPSMQAKRY